MFKDRARLGQDDLASRKKKSTLQKGFRRAQLQRVRNLVGGHSLLLALCNQDISPDVYPILMIQQSLSYEKSQVTKQSEASANFQETPIKQNYFTIQRIDDIYSKQKQAPQNIYHNSVGVIISLESLHKLHSHKINFKQKDAADLYEVTGFSGSDGNDHWRIQLVGDEELKQTDLLQQPTIKRDRPISQLHKQDSFVLRNAFFGSSLHSHNNLYKDSKNQEVTSRYTLERDDNDWWEIIEFDSENNKTNFIQNGSIIGLMHTETNKHLTSILGQKSPSGVGLVVTCKEGNPKANEWQIIG